MPIVWTDVDIINKALARLGAGAISARDEDSDLAAAVEAVYDTTIDRLLGLTTWTFATRTIQLGLRATPPDIGWRYGYDLPAARVRGPLKLSPDARDWRRPLRSFAVEEDVVFADLTPLWARVVVPKAPAEWTPQFRDMAIVVLAAELAVPVADNTTLGAELRRAAYGTAEQQGLGGMVGQAMLLDSQTSGGAAPFGFSCPLIDARGGD